MYYAMIDHLIKFLSIWKGKGKNDKQMKVKLALLVVWATMLAVLIATVVPRNIAVNGEKGECDRGSRNPPQCSWYYLAYAPRILRAGVDEKVLITTYNVNVEVEVKAILRDDRDSKNVIASGVAKVQPGVLTGIVLKVPIGAPSAGTIKIEGEANVSGSDSGLGYDIGWKFENVTKSISIQKSSRTMFIQTDRPIYKPGAAMRFRIVAVDSNLKGLTGENPKNTLIRQWRNVKLQNGVANLKLKFSIKPVLGKWKIQSQMSGLSKTVEVKVEKYVLPKFQVTIKPPSYIALGQSKVFGDICAKYSYGKEVNGFMTAKICALIPGYWSRGWKKPVTNCQAILKKIYGCAPLEINLHSFGVYNYNGYRSIKFKIEASVKERATGISLNATSVTKSIDKTDVKLSFSGTSDIFKPGLPFESVLLVTRPDGSRANNVKVKVEVSVGWSKKLFEKYLIVRNGRAKIDLPDIPFNAKTLRFRAEYQRPKVPGSRISSYRRKTSTYHTAKAWYSPSHSYLSIDVPTKVFKVGQEAAVNVRYTVVDPLPKTRTVYYTLMCKGSVAHSASIGAKFVGTSPSGSSGGDIELTTTKELPTVEPSTGSKEVTTSGSPKIITTPLPPPWDIKPLVGRRWWPQEKPITRPPLPSQFSAGSFQIKFNVTQNMSPSCRMLVYYVRNRETIADSKVIDIEDSFANKVSMTFNKEEVFPGTKVKLSLKASPGSVFAISAVDKSVHFLGNANDISRGQVTSVLNDLDIGPGYIDESSRCKSGRYYWWYYSPSEFVDSQKAFNDNGMMFLSNLLLDSRPCGSDEPVALPLNVDEGGRPGLELAGAGPRGPHGIHYQDLVFTCRGVGILHSDIRGFYRDGGLLFMSNMQIDTRPCKVNQIYPVYDRYRIHTTAVPATETSPPTTQAPTTTTPCPVEDESEDQCFVGLDLVEGEDLSLVEGEDLSLAKGKYITNDAGMIFLSNVVVDSRPCEDDMQDVAFALGSDEALAVPRGGGGLPSLILTCYTSCDAGWNHSLPSIIQDAGMIFLSNVIVDSRPCSGDPGISDFSLVAVSRKEDAVGPEVPPPGRENIRKNVNKPVKKPVKKPPRKQVRSEFPETWLWTEEQLDAQTGEKTIEVKVPDTITTWYASGFAISSSDGLGVANPAEIRGFKALFASVNLPYAVTRGELVTIPVVVFNYLSECVNVRFSMKSTKDIKLTTRDYISTCICGGKTATVMFKGYAKTLGRILIETKAESLPTNICPSSVKFDNNSYIDIVRKKLLVEPEGIEKEYTYNSLVCPDGKEVANNVKLAIPDKVVAGSVYAELRVIGDLMGPSLANIDGLLKMPYGCGEQNMLNFAPNIFIMQYLQATHQLTDEIKQKATDYTLQGYQRELSYKHSDGSYSAFGESDPEGSMWLTAFVLKSFAQARDFIEIDKKVMADAKRWILSKQTKDGCFPSVGTLHNKAMKGGVKTPVTLTGYVVVALLEAGMSSQHPSIRNAMKNCIAADLENINDTYSLNILAYTMNKAGRTRELTYLLTKLDSLAIRENGNRYWGEPKQPEKPRDGWFYAPYRQAKSSDIEQTAYGLMASIPEGDKSKAIDSIDIVRWLSQQRNSLGGWSSTQDTVLAMQALAVFSSIVYGGKQNMTIDVAVPGMSHKFTINSDNKLVLQRLEIPPKFPALLKTYARGQGCSLLSASVKYNVKDVQEDPAFKLEVNLSPLLGKRKNLKFGRCRSQEIDICARWLREDFSNMAIIAVKMLSGFEPITESLDKAVSRDILLKEYEKKEKEYVFYYSRITRKGVCLRFKMKQEQIVENIQPASVKVYDYYETELSATKIYKVTPAQCAGIPAPNPV